MPEILVEGGRRLRGEIQIQGSKNAVLPILAAAVLLRGETVLTHVPAIEDVRVSLDILSALGASCTFLGGRLILDTGTIHGTHVPERLAVRMRSSILFLGSLLGGFGEASVVFPGGCAIGNRPVGLHLSVLEQLGAGICQTDGEIRAKACRLKGRRIRLPMPSVGATEQAVLAAVSALGDTVICGAAREPEVRSLCDFLCACGAGIRGQGTGVIRVTPAPLHGCEFKIPGDRIAAGTYLAAAAMTSGKVTVGGISPEQMESTLSVFRRMGCRVARERETVTLSREGELLPIPYLATEPYPGFPTDMQSLILPLLAVARGDSVLAENIFENRLGLAGELKRMGADIVVRDRRAVIRGVRELVGCPAAAADLRSGAGLLVAALGARGRTRLTGKKYIDRGYEELEGNLKMLGADIRSAG